jgi:hypothetical protein
MYTLTHNRYPNVTEFVSYVIKECEEECEFYLPYTDLFDVIRFALLEYGFVPQCRLAHFMYSFRMFEQRYPSAQEIYNYLQSFLEDTTLSNIASELMERETREYWEKKHSGLTEQDIYKYVHVYEGEQKDEQVCCICQEPIHPGSMIVKLDCAHTFHRGSQYTLSAEDRLEKDGDCSDCVGIEEWLKTSGTCPICRKEVPKVT